MDFDRIQLAATKMEQAVGGIFGLMAALPAAVRQLRLDVDQIIAFCDAVPQGEQLWIAFRTRRDAPGAPEDYNFISYVTDVLATTANPVRS